LKRDFIPHFEYFYKSLALRTCEKCGTVMETDPRFVAKVISASCVLIIWSYFPLSVISMSLLLRTAQLWDATPSGL
jgi:hypothetical protein